MAARRTSSLLIVSAGLLVAAAAYSWGRRSGPPTSAPETSAQARRIAHLESEVLKLGAASGRDELASERKKQAERIAFWDELRRRVDTELVDPNWRSETEAVIERVIPEKLGKEVSVAEVACASSICRAKLSHPAWQRIPDDEFTRFVLHRESLETMEVQLDTREQGVTTLYFLRR